MTLYSLNTRAIGIGSFALGTIAIVLTFITAQATRDSVGVLVHYISAGMSVLTLFGALIGRTPAVPDDRGAKIVNPSPVPPPPSLAGTAPKV